MDSAWGRGADGDSVDPSHRVGGLLPSFIAAAALQLVDQEKLVLTDRITEFFPELVHAKDVRIRELLAHTSGLPDCTGFLGDEEITAAKLLPWLKERELESEPGTCFTFSFTNVILAGALIEKATSVPLDEYLTDVLFEPLGMEETKWCWDGPKIDEQSVSSFDLPGASVEVGDLGRLHGAAGLCSTAQDLSRWQRALVEGRVLNKDSLEAFTSARRLPDGSISHLGYGAYAMKLGEFNGFALGGTMAGFRAHVAYYPDFELGVVLLAEGENIPLRTIERSVARAILDLNEEVVRDLKLDPAEREPYLGTYFIGCTQVTIEEAGDGEHLTAHWAGDYSLRLLYQGRDVFVSAEDPDVSLAFELEDGRATAFTLRERGTETRAKRLN